MNAALFTISSIHFVLAIKTPAAILSSLFQTMGVIKLHIATETIDFSPRVYRSGVLCGAEKTCNITWIRETYAR